MNVENTDIDHVRIHYLIKNLYTNNRKCKYVCILDQF